MKKTQKKIFGFLGLALVAGMTVFAAILPNPEALATSSLTNSIVVRVLEGSPDVNIDNPASGSVFVNPNQTVAFNYSKVNDVVVEMEKAGTTQIYSLFATNASSQPGSGSVNLDLSDSAYGYGEYIVKMRGFAPSGAYDEASANFSYVPVKATVEEDEETGKVYTTLEYDDNSNDLDHFVINVYDDKGNLIEALSPVIVKKGEDKKIELKFAENKIPAGKYTISVAAYDINDEIVYKSYDVVFIYKSIAVPNTGGLLQSLNISQSDYLITGLIIFFMIGIFGIVFIAKNKSKR